MARKAVVEPIIMLVASILMAVLAARGQFTSIMGFPWVFGGMILLFGTLSLRKHRGVVPLTRIGIIVTAFVISFAGGVTQGRYVERVRGAAERAGLAALEGTEAPPFVGLLPISGDAAVLASETAYEGKVTIISFWATWCSPCKRELVELEELYRENRDRGLQVVAVTRFYRGDDEHEVELDKARRFVAKRSLSFPVGMDGPGTFHKLYKAVGLPTTLLVDQSGRIAGYGVGLPGGRMVMEQARSLLSPSPRPPS